MPQVLLIPGLYCGAPALASLREKLKLTLNSNYEVVVVDTAACSRLATSDYLGSIKKRYGLGLDTILVGHGFGGLLANLLLLEGFARRAALISPWLPSDWTQVNWARLQCHWRQIFSNKKTHLNKAHAKKYFFAGVDDTVLANILPTLHAEPASLLQEYIWRTPTTWQHQEGFKYVREHCRGIIITGTTDPICAPRLQTELATNLGFSQHLLSAGHAPHLNTLLADKVAQLVTTFIETGASNAPAPSLRQAAG